MIWWGKKDLIDVVELIVTKYVQNNSEIYNIACHFKMTLHGLIDRPQELLELIDSCLKPKKIETKK